MNDEVIISHWTEELFEIALWKTKRRGEKNPKTGKFLVFIQKSELDAHYISYDLENWTRLKKK